MPLKNYAAGAATIFAVAAVLPDLSMAATLSADTATASSEATASYVAENTINGSGLSSANDPSATHADYFPGNHWTSNSISPLDQYIDWGFNTTQTLGGIYIWNHGSNGGIAANSGYEPTLFDLTLYDDGDNIIESFDDVALAPDTNISQAFAFSSLITGVTRVRFDVEAVQSTPNFTGLAEVLFDDSNTIFGATVLGAPMPASVPLPAVDA